MEFVLKYFYPKDENWGGFDTSTGKVFGMPRFLNHGAADFILSYGLSIERNYVLDFLKLPVGEYAHVFAIKSKF